MPSKIEISHKTIIFTVIFLLTLWFLLQLKEIIFLIFISFILMAAFKPLADYSDTIHVPRILSIILIYILIIAFLFFAGSSILPVLAAQSIHLAEKMPEYLNSVIPFVKIDSSVISQQLTPIGQNLLNVTIGIFANIVTLFTVVVISFYLLLERKHLDKQLAVFMGVEGAKKVVKIIIRIEERLGAWVRGQLLLGVTIGLATFVGISILGLPYALAMAIFAGILEIVPIIGPIISAIPAVLIALTTSPLLALLTVAVYFIIQQLEAQLIVPVVMEKAVGIPPLVTIIALMMGAKLDGIAGALLAVPTFVTVETIISEYLKLRETH
ncbi:MAG: AI-2E family transporter [Patescibacteria group bacterium]|nr:AI-2E family transporter [Patescibacteria group bacterium]